MHLLRGPIDHIPFLDSWWSKGTTREVLKRAGVNIEGGFLSLTKQFRLMHHGCHRRSQWIDDFHHFLSTMSSLPSPITSMEDDRCCML
eukprot:9933533-Prorocentrum_lima.AAC.1